MKILAIDPGNEQSAYVVYDTETRLPYDFGLVPNAELLDTLEHCDMDTDMLAMEMIASYGMAVGKTVFETVFWLGRFVQAYNGDFKLIYRKDVKMHLCYTMKAKDSNIRQAIMDLYGSDRQTAIGTKKNPGPLYGFKKDIWAAMGVALTAAARMKGVA